MHLPWCNLIVSLQNEHWICTKPELEILQLRQLWIPHMTCHRGSAWRFWVVLAPSVQHKLLRPLFWMFWASPSKWTWRYCRFFVTFPTANATWRSAGPKGKVASWHAPNQEGRALAPVCAVSTTETAMDTLNGRTRQNRELSTSQSWFVETSSWCFPNLKTIW